MVECMGSDTQEAVEYLQLPEPACEYHIYEEIRILKEAMEAEKVTEACTSKYLVQDERLYHSNKDEEVSPRLYVPQGLLDKILELCHDKSYGDI